MRRSRDTPFPSGRLFRRAPTLREWAEYWLATDTAKRPKTKKEDANSLELHVFPTLGAKRIDEITVLEVRRLVAGWADEVMPRTVRRRYAVLRAAFHAAVEADLLGRSPCRGIRMPPTAPKFGYALSAEEVARVAEEVGPRYEAMIYTGAMLGLRFCECAGLRVGRIDFDANTISVQESLVEADVGRLYSNPPKSHAGRRTMCMPPSLSARLAEHLARRGLTADDMSAYVFASPSGGPLRYSNFRKRVWQPAIARAGVPRIGFHDLRRTNATILVAEGVDLKTAQIRLGHADPSLTLGLYAQATTAGDRAAAAVIDGYFTSAVSAVAR
jgi:integrase